VARPIEKRGESGSKTLELHADIACPFKDDVRLKSSQINFENHGADFRRPAMRLEYDLGPMAGRAVKTAANNNV